MPRITTLVLLLAALALAPLAPAQEAATTGAESDAAALTLTPDDPYAWFDPIIDVQRFIVSGFVTPPDLRELQIGAINGMIETLDDPYTLFVPEESVADFDKAVRGEYVGIGATVNTQDGWATIVSPLDDSPALAAGLLPGDRIVEVDSETTAGERLDETIDRIVGERGTVVTLTIERAGERLEVPIERQPIVTRSVAGFVRDGAEWDYMIDDETGVGYIRLVSFGPTAAREFREALESLQQQGARGLIVDLRENSGGLLSAAVSIADLFLSDGVIVETRGRTARDETYYATRETPAPDLPLLVMVTRRSASASEVLAGALKDQGRAVVLGERSFGKGLVQNVLQLPSGAGQLKITEQRYFGPSGRMIHREDGSEAWGVDPTEGFFVTMTNRQTGEMLRQRSRDTVIGAGATPSPSPGQAPEAWVRDPYGDEQLAAAIEAVRAKITTGEWAPVSDEADTAAPARQELLYAARARDRILRELERASERIEALSHAASADEADELSLLPDDAELEGGTVEIRDARGDVVRTLRITGDDLERWLVDAPLEPSSN